MVSYWYIYFNVFEGGTSMLSCTDISFKIIYLLRNKRKKKRKFSKDIVTFYKIIYCDVKLTVKRLLLCFIIYTKVIYFKQIYFHAFDETLKIFNNLYWTHFQTYQLFLQSQLLLFNLYITGITAKSVWNGTLYSSEHI